MKTLLALGMIALLGLMPSIVDAGVSNPTAEQPPEQRRLLTKDQIRLVQERLRAEGFDPGSDNGVLDSQTETAIRQYQQKQGIPVSGALDEATMRELQLPEVPGAGGTGGGGGQ